MIRLLHEAARFWFKVQIVSILINFAGISTPKVELWLLL